MNQVNSIEWNASLKNKTIAEKIDDFIKQNRPKEVRRYQENGHIVTVYERG